MSHIILSIALLIGLTVPLWAAFCRVQLHPNEEGTCYV